MNPLESSWQKLVEREVQKRLSSSAKRRVKTLDGRDSLGRINPGRRRPPEFKIPNRELLIDRMMSRIDRSGDQECWIWTGSLNEDGYGKCAIFGGECLSHRLIYRLIVGPIDKGMCVLHDCDNPPCCNPGHLKLGTHMQNVGECFNKRRHPCQRLTDEQIEEMRAIHRSMTPPGHKKASKFTNIMLGKKFGVHWNHVAHIVMNGKSTLYRKANRHRQSLAPIS